jgi:hypothetical protein
MRLPLIAFHQGVGYSISVFSEAFKQISGSPDPIHSFSCNQLKKRNSCRSAEVLYEKRESGTALGPKLNDDLAGLEPTNTGTESQVENLAGRKMVGPGGLEPLTSSVSRKRSNQLSYGPATHLEYHASARLRISSKCSNCSSSSGDHALPNFCNAARLSSKGQSREAPRNTFHSSFT